MTASATINDASSPDDGGEDNQLMLDYANGNVQAFNTLYARYEKRLYAFIERGLGKNFKAQAEEVFHDTWMRVIQARSRWQKDGAKFSTWLFTIATNCFIDRLRKSGREVALPENEQGETFVPEGAPWSAWPAAPAAGAVDDDVFWRRAGQRLLDCMEQLPGEQKAVFLLVHDQGKALDEHLAHALDINFEAAKSRLRYAMNKLRLCMGAYIEPLRHAAER